MITRLTGVLTRVLDEEARLAVGPIEYQILLPESVRRQLQFRTGQEVSLHISEYLEGNQSGTRFVPRKLGFLTEQELDFFELLCTVDKIGAKKALKAMSRPVVEIAQAINRGDAAWLSTLPGIGGTTAEQLITTLKKKMPPFLVSRAEPTNTSSAVEPPIVTEEEPPKKGKKKFVAAPADAPALPSGELVEDVYNVLLATGLGPQEARLKVDALLASRQPFATVQEALNLMFRSKKEPF